MRVLTILFLKKMESDDLFSVAESCLKFSPQIAMSDEAIFIEIGRCQNLYSEDFATLAVHKMLTKCFNFERNEFSIAIADHISTSLAFARYPQVYHLKVDSKKDLLPVDAIRDYLDPFGKSKNQDEQRILLAKMIITLNKLGMNTIGKFLALPARSITSRFGKRGLWIAQGVRHVKDEAWPGFQPKQRIEEQTILDGTPEQSIQSLEPVMFLLKKLTDIVVARLYGRAEQALSVEIGLTQERYSTVSRPKRSWVIEFALPQNNALSMLPIFYERLDKSFQRKPLEAPIERLWIRVLETAPWVGSQNDFFSVEGQKQEALGSLVSRVGERVGKENVFKVKPVENHLPEKSWQKIIGIDLFKKGKNVVFDGKDPKDLPYAKRPLRVLKKPEKLHRLGPFLILKQKKWKVLGSHGPEHLCGNWWYESEIFNRHYYKLKTDVGEQLWVFQDLLTEELYLHGYFD